MSYLVSARKYRPRQFDEVLGQSHISSTLQKALDSDHIAHAFLFCGPRGVGKTTCARIMAKVLNCENRPNPHTACDQCDSCRAFQDNASFNIIELDAASNNSVENIRSLIEQVRFQPQKGKYKIFIIDEVHMLSTSAFNAFLKTLEEPPSYAIFILATTEKHKIIPTILSRCQVFDFKRIQVEDMVAQLKKIAEQEDRSYEIEALHIIAEKADGAMRDALSIFDRISGTGEAITYKQVVENLNILDYDTFFQVTETLLLEDIPGVMIRFNDVVRRGFEPDHFINGLAQHFRNVLVAKQSATFPLLEVSEQLKEKYIAQGNLLTHDFLLTAMNLANQCDINYPRAKNKVLHTEITLCKMAKINRVLDNTATLPAEKKTEVKTTNKKNPTEHYQTTPVGAKPSDIADAEVEPKHKPVVLSPKPEKKKTLLPRLNSLEDLVRQVAEEEAKNNVTGLPLTIDNLKKVWNEYSAAIDSQSVSSILKNTYHECTNDSIKVYVPSQIAKETLIQESGLIQNLRKVFNIPDLPLEIVVDIRQFPEYKAPEKPKMLSPQEKFSELSAINPMISELVKRFDLQSDNE